MLFLSFVSFSVNGQFFKKEKAQDNVLKYGDYRSIIDHYGSVDPNEIASQFKILGEANLEYGDYEKASVFYGKALLLDKKNVQEKDVINYYYSLLKCQKEEDILTDPLGESFSRSSKIVRQLIKNAESREFYKKLRIPDITIKEMDIEGILPRYGLIFNDYYLYFSYQKEPGSEKELFENDVFSFRVAERSYLGKARFIPTGGIGAEGPVICKLKDKQRVVTFSRSLKNDVDFYTIVPENGEPEQIGIRGDEFSSFPFNSREYACAMPFFDEQSGRLYFCSNMRGGMGGWDIYYSVYNGTRWNNPVNMGNVVNSPFDELFPIVCDSLLFFSSDGWEGYGGFDNYVFNDKDDSLINLIFSNKEGDDYCFQIVNGDKFQGIGIKDKTPSFFTYDQTFNGLLDSVKLSINQGSEKETILEKKESNETEAQEAYLLPVLPEKNADLLITATGKQSKQLGTVFFDTNSPVLKSNYYSQLDNIVQQIIDTGLKNIVVWGHTDRTGTGRYNDYLSFMRASGVVEYMKSRLVADGNQRFFTISAGREYAEGASESEENDRKVVIREGLKKLPYSVIYVYKALPKQSLDDVAKMFNNDVEKIKLMNEITSMPENRLLLVGIQGMHMVKSGENLFRISKIFHCSEESLQRLNKKEDRSVYAGERLFIPLPDVK